MGNCCLPIRFRRTHSAGRPKNVTLLLLGLDNSGKTTIAKRLAGEPIDSVVSTVGFSVVLLREKSCHVSIYDLGGGPQIRDIWPRYYADAHGVIFVTDAHDPERMIECRETLEKILRNDQIGGKPILLLANKQDLEGALDEIDIVDCLNLEELVNERKCPTLVELCSALNFSKKIDIGIENGYKWLIRSIIRDYPNLNNRVVRDLARQEEENKIEVIHNRVEETADIFARTNGNLVREENGHPNRGKKPGVGTNSVIPGLIDEIPKEIRPRAEIVYSASSQFFVVEKFQSDLKLLNEVPNHTFNNFLVRPKSSGARLYGVKTERKRPHKRKPLHKGNKTRPSPFTDISNGQVPKALEPRNGDLRDRPLEKVNPFVLRAKQEMWPGEGSKSVPNSRRGSVNLPKKRRHSLVNEKNEGRRTGEILLDVTRLRN